MSEYQYYEFLALDRPLTTKEMEALRKLSSRVELTPNRAVFTYSYRDFPGDPLTVLARSFDAMLYMSNFGNRQLALRFPKTALDPRNIKPHCVPDALTLSTVKEHVIIDIHTEQEDLHEWIEGEGQLSALAPLRGEILAGDMRGLYLAWLSAAESCWYEDEPAPKEPPLPAGLNKLSRAQKALCDFFALDSDLLAVAAEGSETLSPARPIDLEAGLLKLSEKERLSFLARLVKGEPLLREALLRRLAPAPSPKANQKDKRRRTLSALLKAAEARREQRQKREKQAAARARAKELAALANKTPALWKEVEGFIEKKLPKAYDHAIPVLKTLQEIAEHQGTQAAFQEKIDTLYRTYSNRPALLDRLKYAGLLRSEAATNKPPGEAVTSLQGTWRIKEMELWERDYLDMEVPAYLTIQPDGGGEFQFGLVQGELDGRFGTREGKPSFTFSFEAMDEMEPTSGRGFGVLSPGGGMLGRFAFHGDDSSFRAVKVSETSGPLKRRGRRR